MKALFKLLENARITLQQPVRISSFQVGTSVVYAESESACWIALTLNNRSISIFYSAKMCSSTCSSYSHYQS